MTTIQQKTVENLELSGWKSTTAANAYNARGTEFQLRRGGSMTANGEVAWSTGHAANLNQGNGAVDRQAY
jgi:hypothetical protein